MLRLRLSTVAGALGGVVGGSLHCLLQFDVRLSSKQNLAHPGDIVLQEMFVQGVRNMQLADECECRDVLTAVGNLDQLALDVPDVGLEAVTLPHFDGEKMVVVSLGFLAR